MARHSKWAQIKRQKSVADAKRSQRFTQHAKLISMAAQKGIDPAMNPNLRLAIDKAKADNMPNENIERAIKKGSGALKEGKIIEELYYEAYAPGGVALYIQALTDNKNRTAASVRLLIHEHEGTLATQGSVAFLFEKRAVFFITIESITNREELELGLIDCGVTDLEEEDHDLIVSADYMKFAQLKNFLLSQNIPIPQSSIQLMPKTTVEISEENKVKLQALIAALEADEDISEVVTNALL